MEDPYLRSIYSGDRRPYDPNLAPHPNAPRAQYYPAFTPGMLAGLRDQLAKGYGPKAQQDPNAPQTGGGLASADPYFTKNVEDRLKGTYKDTVATYAPQPITAVMADFAKAPYQQYNQNSGSPFLNSLLGFLPPPSDPATGQPPDPVPNPTPSPPFAAGPSPAPAPAPSFAPGTGGTGQFDQAAAAAAAEAERLRREQEAAAAAAAARTITKKKVPMTRDDAERNLIDTMHELRGR